MPAVFVDIEYIQATSTFLISHEHMVLLGHYSFYNLNSSFTTKAPVIFESILTQ